MRTSVIVAFMFGVLSACPDTNAPKGAYPNDFRVALKIAQDLCESLPNKYRVQISPQPVTLDPGQTPIITPIERVNNNKVMREVSITDGFISLINHVAHARAIDNIQPGYFQRYILNLARENSDRFVLDAPDMIDPRYWTDGVLNDQMSYFNQMAGIIIAINLSHHYLGHFAKYGPKLKIKDQSVPINNYLSEPEWNVSVKAGALNSLDTAMATEGARALFEALGKVPRRPAWTAFFIPLNADVKKLNKQLAGYETDYFRGQLK